MTTEDQNSQPRQYVGEQRAEIKLPGEARKGVNVLNTSDSKNPAINPFVPVQNQTSNQQASQSTQSNQGNNSQSKENG